MHLRFLINNRMEMESYSCAHIAAALSTFMDLKCAHILLQAGSHLPVLPTSLQTLQHLCLWNA